MALPRKNLPIHTTHLSGGGRDHGSFRFPVGGNVHWNAHGDYWEAALVIGGTGVHMTLSEKKRVRRGSVVVMVPGVPHRWRGEDSLEVLFLQVTRPFFSGWHTIWEDLPPSPGGPLGSLSAFLKSAEAPYLVERLHADGVLVFQDTLAAFKKGGPKSDFTKRVAFLRLIQVLEESHGAELRRRALGQTERPDVLLHLSKYIQENHAQDLTVEGLASRTPFSPDHLARLFRKRTGYRLTEYVHEVRLKEFCRLAEEGGAGISRAAAAVGYQNIPYFNRVFKSFLGTTPTLWLSRRPSPPKSGPQVQPLVRARK